MLLEKCEKCRGGKKILSLGNIYKNCDRCQGVGYEEKSKDECNDSIFGRLDKCSDDITEHKIKRVKKTKTQDMFDDEVEGRRLNVGSAERKKR
jgi:hypothetical protein